MVGSMSVAVLVVVVLSAPISQAKTCNDPNAHKFTNRSCIYVRHNLPIQNLPMLGAKFVCRSLNEYPIEWDVPRVDTMWKHDRLEQIVDKVVVPMQTLYFFIDLLRDIPTSNAKINANEWTDMTKWRWMSDNSTLELFPGKIPWWPGQPNGWKVHLDMNGMREHCVAEYKSPKQKLSWYDGHCTGVDASWGNAILVCESKDISTTTTTPKKTTQKTTPKKTTPKTTPKKTTPKTTTPKKTTPKTTPTTTTPTTTTTTPTTTTSTTTTTTTTPTPTTTTPTTTTPTTTTTTSTTTTPTTTTSTTTTPTTSTTTTTPTTTTSTTTTPTTSTTPTTTSTTSTSMITPPPKTRTPAETEAPRPPETNAPDPTEGIDQPDATPPSDNTSGVLIGISVSLFVVSIVAIVGGIIIYKRYRKQRMAELQIELGMTTLSSEQSDLSTVRSGKTKKRGMKSGKKQLAKSKPVNAKKSEVDKKDKNSQDEAKEKSLKTSVKKK